MSLGCFHNFINRRYSICRLVKCNIFVGKEGICDIIVSMVNYLINSGMFGGFNSGKL